MGQKIKHPLKNDWNTTAKLVLNKLQIMLSYEEITEMKKSIFKKLVRKKVEALAFLELTEKEKSGRKGRNIDYGEKLQMADYLLPESNINLED